MICVEYFYSTVEYILIDIEYFQYSRQYFYFETFNRRQEELQIVLNKKTDYLFHLYNI